MDAEIQTKKIMRKAIQVFAEKQGEEVKDTQVLIYTEDSEECNPKYRITSKFKDFSPLKEITLKELMQVPKVDFTGKGLIASTFVEPQIKGLIRKLSMENKVQADKVSVFVATNDNECNDLRLILCLDSKPKGLLSFKYLFGD